MAYTREQRLAAKAAYREKHREELAAKQRAYHAEHREECNERTKRNRKPQTSEERRAWKRAYDARPEVKERNREHARRFRIKYPEKAQSIIVQTRRRAKANLEVLAGRPRPAECEVCGGPPTKNGFVFDHCHQHGHFRGWLCHNCNVILGLAKDNTDRLRKLIAYLDRTRENTAPQLTLSGI
jgi:hypothetical protein